MVENLKFNFIFMYKYIFINKKAKVRWLFLFCFRMFFYINEINMQRTKNVNPRIKVNLLINNSTPLSFLF